MKPPKHKEERQQLDLPDYSGAYIEYMRKKEQEKVDNPPETVVIIDIY